MDTSRLMSNKHEEVKIVSVQEPTGDVSTE